jgi:hypothetical protein
MNRLIPTALLRQVPRGDRAGITLAALRASLALSVVEMSAAERDPAEIRVAPR